MSKTVLMGNTQHALYEARTCVKCGHITLYEEANFCSQCGADKFSPVGEFNAIQPIKAKIKKPEPEEMDTKQITPDGEEEKIPGDEEQKVTPGDEEQKVTLDDGEQKVAPDDEEQGIPTDGVIQRAIYNHQKAIYHRGIRISYGCISISFLFIIMLTVAVSSIASNLVLFTSYLIFLQPHIGLILVARRDIKKFKKGLISLSRNTQLAAESSPSNPKDPDTSSSQVEHELITDESQLRICTKCGHLIIYPDANFCSQCSSPSLEQLNFRKFPGNFDTEDEDKCSRRALACEARACVKCGHVTLYEEANFCSECGSDEFSLIDEDDALQPEKAKIKKPEPDERDTEQTTPEEDEQGTTTNDKEQEIKPDYKEQRAIYYQKLRIGYTCRFFAIFFAILLTIPIITVPAIEFTPPVFLLYIFFLQPHIGVFLIGGTDIKAGKKGLRSLPKQIQLTARASTSAPEDPETPVPEHPDTAVPEVPATSLPQVEINHTIVTDASEARKCLKCNHLIIHKDALHCLNCGSKELELISKSVEKPQKQEQLVDEFSPDNQVISFDFKICPRCGQWYPETPFSVCPSCHRALLRSYRESSNGKMKSGSVSIIIALLIYMPLSLFFLGTPLIYFHFFSVIATIVLLIGSMVLLITGGMKIKEGKKIMQHHLKFH